MRMPEKKPARSPIMKAVHEAATDLRRLGLIDQSRMRTYDLMCLEPISGDAALNGTIESTPDIMQGLPYSKERGS